VEAAAVSTTVDTTARTDAPVKVKTRPMRAECYSQRLLNPFRGSMNCIRYRSADAVTADGVHWDIYVSNEALLEGLPGQRKAQVSDIRFGSWSRARGLRRGPLFPSDDFLQLEAMGQRLYEILLETHGQVPFPFRDDYELWLLDRELHPLALLESALTEQDISRAPSLQWSPGLNSRKTFTSQAAAPLGIDRTRPGAVADYLSAYINRLAGPQPVAQLFRREADGSGRGLGGCNLPDAIAGRRLERTVFPADLIDLQRHDELHGRLLQDFVCWQAPWHLVRHDLDSTARGEFERHASVQPLKVAHQYRLYPAIVDRRIIDAARVEARLREAMPVTVEAEKIMSTFYIELNPEVAD
jgi:hypothetical protein